VPERIESSVTSVSWIPRDAITGLTKLPFDLGVAHYDLPPPDVMTDPAELVNGDRVRFVNRLAAWAEIDDDGTVAGFGHLGKGLLSNTTLKLGRVPLAFTAVTFPVLRPDPEVGPGFVRFVQSAGGRTGVPAPRRVRRPPFWQVNAPTAWSTLALTLRADGTAEHEVLGASPFPRHWFYDGAGQLIAKTGIIDFETWYRESFGEATPWGAEDSPPLVTAVESALERQLSVIVIGFDPPFRRLVADEVLVEQGEASQEVFLLFDGVLRVEIDGQAVTEVGPGAILGEMAGLGDGRRTATLRAVTPCRVAVVPPDRLDRQALEQLASSRRPPVETDADQG
jgi:hypothetical protein